jgi:hypothetical protein
VGRCRRQQHGPGKLRSDLLRIVVHAKLNQRIDGRLAIECHNPAI